MKKIYLLIQLILTVNFCFSQEIVDGYYISNTNDTIKTKIIISDLFALHKEVVTIDANGVTHKFFPSNIKGFSFTTKKEISCSTPFDSLDHSNDNLFIKMGYKYKKPTFSLDPEIHALGFWNDTTKIYESVKLNDKLSLFLIIKSGSGGVLKSGICYAKTDITEPFYSIIWFLIKNNNIVERKGQKLNEWIINCVNEYPVLTKIIKEGKLSAFPFDFNIVIDDYNNWCNLKSESRPDTSMAIKGILDANKYYRPTKQYVFSCIAGTAFFFPGMITAIILAHNPKEKNIKIPDYLQNKENPEYMKTFKHRAYEKKYRSAAHGALTGGVLSIGLIILLATLGK